MKKNILFILLIFLLLLTACSNTKEEQPKKVAGKDERPQENISERIAILKDPNVDSLSILDKLKTTENGDKLLLGYQMLKKQDTLHNLKVIMENKTTLSSSDLAEKKNDKPFCHNGLLSPNGKYFLFNCLSDQAAFSIYDFEQEKVVYREKKGRGEITLHDIKFATPFSITDEGEIFIGSSESKLLLVINFKEDKSEILDLTKKIDGELGIERLFVRENGKQLIFNTQEQVYVYNRETKDIRTLVKPEKDSEIRIHITGVSENGKYLLYEKLIIDGAAEDRHVFVNLKTGKEQAYNKLSIVSNPDNDGNVVIFDRDDFEKVTMISLFNFENGDNRLIPLDNKTYDKHLDKIILSSEGKRIFYTKEDDSSKNKHLIYRFIMKDIGNYKEMKLKMKAD